MRTVDMMAVAIVDGTGAKDKEGSYIHVAIERKDGAGIEHVKISIGTAEQLMAEINGHLGTKG